MNLVERAWQVWPLLAYAAGNRQLLTYKIVGRLTGMAVPGLGRVLEPIQSYCLLNGLPALTALVVNTTRGRPGEGFVGAEDPLAEFIRIFEHDWINTRCPNPAELDQAVRERPSNGIGRSR